METIYTVLILSALTVVVGIPFNCICSKGINKKIVLIANGVFIAVTAGVIIYSTVDDQIIKKQTGADNFAQTVWFTPVTLSYSETIGDYYIISQRGLFFDTSFIAVPKGNIVLPDDISPDTKIRVAYKKTAGKSWFKDDRITINGRDYYYADSVTGIYPDHSEEHFNIIFFDIIAAVTFNLFELPAVIYGMAEQRRKQKISENSGAEMKNKNNT